jgi:hypothetical protein
MGRVDCKYISENEFSDFKENFHVLIQTLNHSVTSIKSDVNSMKISSAVMNNSVRNISKVLWGLLGLLGTIATGITIALLTRGL